MKREATFERIVAVDLNGDDENDQRSAEEVLLATIGGLLDDKLTGFAVQLALAGHRSMPRENEFDFLTEAEAVFAPRDKQGQGRRPSQKADQKLIKKPTAAEAAPAKAKAKKATPKRSKALTRFSPSQGEHATLRAH